MSEPTPEAGVANRREGLDRLKTRCLAEGIRIEPMLLAELASEGPLTVHEYATTGGLTLELAEGVLVNAPFDDWYCEQAVVTMQRNARGGLELADGSDIFAVERVLPLPGYLGSADAQGRAVTDVAMSHADRIRLSPIMGCAYDCAFCDIPRERYRRRDAEQLVAALEVAAGDTALPARHVLISGGSPGTAHHDYFEATCAAVVEAASGLDRPLEVDVMMSPWPEDADLVRRLSRAGVWGWSINTEIFSPGPAQLYIGKKHRFARPGLEQFIETAVDATGGGGRVRSLLVVGLEPFDATLEAVEWLAGKGCDPVLSPFRPARNTELAQHAPVAAEWLQQLLGEARSIVAAHGVRLGPRCVPCQHNTLSLPWDVT